MFAFKPKTKNQKPKTKNQKPKTYWCESPLGLIPVATSKPSPTMAA